MKKTTNKDEFDQYLRTDHLAADLKGRSVRGGAFTMTSQGCKFILGMASTVVLARLLTPQDFGLVAMVTAVTGFIAMFKDMGLSMATVQRKDITHEQVSILFWINLFLSILIMLITAGTASAISWFYKEPRLTSITIVTAFGFLFGGLTVQHQALLRRQMRFGALAVIAIISMLAGITTAIYLAWAGAGYWALVLMPVSSGFADAVMVWFVCGWRPGLPVRGAGVRFMLYFGGNLTGFNLLNYFARNLDNVLVGRFWGPGQLGLYSKAYSLLLLPIRQINAPISAIAVPALSILQNDPNGFKNYYLKALTLLTSVTTPLAVFLFLLSEDIIALVLGPQWLEVSSIFRVLSISAISQPICNTSGWLYVSTGNTRDLLKWGSLGIAFIIASFLIGLPYGAIGVATAYSITILLWTWPCMYFATRHTSIQTTDIFKGVLPNLIGSLIGGSVIVIIKCFFVIDFPLWARIALFFSLMTITYVLAIFYIFKKGEFYLSILYSLKRA